MRKRLLGAIACFLVACSPARSQSSELIAPAQFHEQLKARQQPQLIDVRTPEEYQSGHLPGAKLITLQGSNFTQQMQQLDPSQPVYLYCHRGGRSAAAARRLADMGFVKIYDLRGGILAWNRQNLPLAKEKK